MAKRHKKNKCPKRRISCHGTYPKTENKRLWNNFRELSREFNQAKNLFYKEQKSQEKQYIEAKKSLDRRSSQYFR